MLPNNQPGFYIIAKDCEGKVRIVRFYETLDALVRAETYFYAGEYGRRQYFSESLEDRVPYHWDKYYYLRNDCFGETNEATQGAYVVIDHLENVVPTCELNRVANVVRSQRWGHHYYRNSGRHTAWRWFRRPKTTQERRAYYDTLDQEVPIKVRGRRHPRQIPSAWDDLYAHNDKCWKTQTKRRHQWKGE